jgi:hypothetical protein
MKANLFLCAAALCLTAGAVRAQMYYPPQPAYPTGYYPVAYYPGPNPYCPTPMPGATVAPPTLPATPPQAPMKAPAAPDAATSAMPAMPAMPGMGAMAGPAPDGGGYDMTGQAPEAGAQPASSYQPQMIGDRLAVVNSIYVDVAHAKLVTLSPPSGVTVNGNIVPRPAGGSLRYDSKAVYVSSPTLPFPGTSIVLLPPNTRATYIGNGNVEVFRTVEVPNERGPVKIADNDSPRPMDRVFATFNYFGDTYINNVEVYREVVGFERTFCDECASIELRVPIIQLTGQNTGESTGDIGDLTAVLKYALVTCGDSLISVGVLATAPTGPRYVAFNGDKEHGFTAEPFVGFILDCGYLYFQGFGAVQLPLHRGDVTTAYADLAIGYYTYMGCKDDLLSFVVPTIEAHGNVPLDHREPSSAIFARDELNVIGGVHFGLGEHTVVTVAGGVPTVGPKPFDFEGVVQLNVRW